MYSINNNDHFPSFLSIEDYLEHQWTILFQFDLNIFATAEDLPHYLLSSDTFIKLLPDSECCYGDNGSEYPHVQLQFLLR